MKILAVNVAFHSEAYYKRWRLMAQGEDISVVLVGPKILIYKDAGQPIVYESKDVKEGAFKAFHVDMKPKKYLRYDWCDWSLVSIIKNEQPDLVYLIGYESRNALFLTKIAQVFSRKKFKIGLFSMRGKDIPEWNKEFMWRWKLGRKWYDFVHVHYPEGRRIYKEQIGFQKPICISTQIGFDKDIYFKDKAKRTEVLAQYGIGADEFVFMSTMRVEAAKGLHNIIEACETLRDKSFRFLILGDGKEMQQAKEIIEKKGLRKKLLLLGMVKNGKEVANHLNASDCFVHVPMNTKQWVDTFPLAVVQAMGCGLPVLGSKSGAVPYQTGEYNPLLIPENNSEALAAKMLNIMEGKYDLKTLGEKALKRSLDCFEIRHLNRCLVQNFQSYINDSDDLIEDVVYPPNLMNSK